MVWRKISKEGTNAAAATCPVTGYQLWTFAKIREWGRLIIISLRTPTLLTTLASPCFDASWVRTLARHRRGLILVEGKRSWSLYWLQVAGPQHPQLEKRRHLHLKIVKFSLICRCDSCLQKLAHNHTFQYAHPHIVPSYTDSGMALCLPVTNIMQRKWCCAGSGLKLSGGLVIYNVVSLGNLSCKKASNAAKETTWKGKPETAQRRKGDRLLHSSLRSILFHLYLYLVSPHLSWSKS